MFLSIFRTESNFLQVKVKLCVLISVQIEAFDYIVHEGFFLENSSNKELCIY